MNSASSDMNLEALDNVPDGGGGETNDTSWRRNIKCFDML